MLQQYISPVDALLDPTHLKSRPPPNGIPTSLDVKCALALATRDALVISHLERLAALAKHMKRKLPPSFDLDDLISHGVIALIEAAGKYRPGRAKFWSYAYLKVRGAMAESARRKNWRENTLEPLTGDMTSGSKDIYFQGIEQAMLVDRLRAAIAGLPAQQREVLASTYRNLGRRKHRSREKIRRTLREHGAAIDELRRRLG